MTTTLETRASGKTGLVIFLIKGSYISVYCLKFALTDFLEQYEDEQVFLSKQDYSEITKIRKDNLLLTKSYLFKKIEPFLLPYFERKH